MVNFIDFGGAITGKLLPTGNTIDKIELDHGQEIEVTILDAGNMLVFVKASSLGLGGTELSDVMDQEDVKNRIEEIRVQCGMKIDLYEEGEVVTPETHALPKIVIVSEPADYMTENGERVDKNRIDIVGRYISMGTLHRAIAVSGAIGLGAVCQIPGTIPNQVMSKSNQTDQITIGHPTGTILVKVHLEESNFSYRLVRGGIGRTARRIMEGEAFVPVDLLDTNSIYIKNKRGRKSEKEISS